MHHTLPNKSIACYCHYHKPALQYEISFGFFSIWLLPIFPFSPLSYSASLQMLSVEVSRDQKKLSSLVSFPSLVLLSTLVWLCDRTEFAPCSPLQLVSFVNFPCASLPVSHSWWNQVVSVYICPWAPPLRAIDSVPMATVSSGAGDRRAPSGPHHMYLQTEREEGARLKGLLKDGKMRGLAIRHEMVLYDKLTVA